jgi:hypothetical protein
LCSGLIIQDTNVGSNIATINEVSNDQQATLFSPNFQQEAASGVSPATAEENLKIMFGII